jgi:HPt (histidine-containing phosphotransfer) domain-containing protein
MHTSAIHQPTFDELKEAAGAEFALELVGTFLEEAPPMLAELHAARGAGQDERFRRAAHSLKSNAQTFGALVLAERARALELGALPADDAALDALQAAYAEAAAALEALRRG